MAVEEQWLPRMVDDLIDGCLGFQLPKGNYVNSRRQARLRYPVIDRISGWNQRIGVPRLWFLVFVLFSVSCTSIYELIKTLDFRCIFMLVLFWRYVD